MSKPKELEIKKIKVGGLLFKEGDKGSDMFLLRKGQIRMFRSKGKGFVEMGMLSPGDLLGESSIFEEKDEAEVRAYSAECVSECEVMAVSVKEFKQDMIAGVNQVFKIIFTALLNKLKKMNLRIKELEQNSLSFADGNEYVYIKNFEVGRILGMLFLLAKSFGNKSADGVNYDISRKILKIYASDMYGLAESKVESLLNLLKEFDLVSMQQNAQDGSVIVCIKDMDQIKNMVNFYQADRFVAEEKKIRVTLKCQQLLDKMLLQIAEGKDVIPVRDEGWVCISIEEILAYFKERNTGIDIDDLADAVRIAFIKEPMVSAEGKRLVEVHVERLKKYLPILKFQQAVKKLSDNTKA